MMMIHYEPIEKRALHQLSHCGYQSFLSFSTRFNQTPEFLSPSHYFDCIVASLSRPDTFHLMAYRPCPDSLSLSPSHSDAVSVSGSGSGDRCPDVECHVSELGDVVGSVVMECANEVCSIGPISVRDDLSGRGIGQSLMVRCITHAKSLHKDIRLVNIVVNINAFALYAKLGFVARLYMGHLCGDLHERAAQDVTRQVKESGRDIRAMRVEDIDECNRLFISACGLSRRDSITRHFHSPFAVNKPTCGTDGYTSLPSTAAFVVYEVASQRICGYVDNVDVDGHWLCEDEISLIALYHHATQQMKKIGIICDMHVIASLYPSLFQKMLHMGAKVTRQLCVMSLGNYMPPTQGYVYCPSIMF